MSKLATNTQTTSRINSETLPELLRKINALPDAGSGGNEAVIEALNITENGTYNATETVDGYAPITVNVPIPEGYIQPEGTKTITENGTYDVTEFASAVVEVPTGGSDDSIDELISKEITEVMSNATKVGAYVFQECSSLTTADFPLATSIGFHAFFQCSKLTTVNFPLATSIGDYAFQKCLKLTTVNFPLATSIKNKMFDRCSSLTTADFSLVTSIGSYAFGDCYRLTTLILRSETMATLDNINAFNYCYHFHGTTNGNYNPTGAKDGYFYVPRALLSDTDEANDYRRAKNWATFGTQFRALEDFTVDGTITGELDPNKI